MTVGMLNSRVGRAHAVLIRYIETGAACEHGTEIKRQLSRVIDARVGAILY